ncbi:Porin D precursor [compost metagenome]
MLGYKSGYTDGTVGFGVDTLRLLGITLDTGKGRQVGSSMIPSNSDNRAVDEWSRLG